MAGSLFDIIYSGYSTPLAAEQLKAQTQLEQVKTQTAAAELAQQKAQIQMMQKIWGSPLGADAATGTDADLQKLNMTAAYLMQTGNTKDATAVMSRISSIQERQAQTQKDSMNVEAQRRQDLSQTAGAVTDQATYSAAFPSIMDKLGPDAKQLKLTGIYDQDKSKLDFLSKLGATWAQKQSVADREKGLDEKNFFDGIKAQMAQVRLDQRDKQLDIAQRTANRADMMAQHKIEEDAIKDARAQAGLKRDPAKEYTQNLKVSKMDFMDAQSAFKLDPRTQDMDANLQDRYAQIAAGKAKQIMADTLRKDPNADFDYEATVSGIMDDMEKQGLFKPTSTGGVFSAPAYTYKSPTWSKTANPGTGTGTPKAGQASKPSAPADQFTTLDAVQKAVKSGALTRDQGIAIARSKGWVQ